MVLVSGGDSNVLSTIVWCYVITLPVPDGLDMLNHSVFVELASSQVGMCIHLRVIWIRQLGLNATLNHRDLGVRE